MHHTDCHAHTSASYCADEDMRLQFYLDAIAKGDGQDKVVIADHSMAIYFPKDIAWGWSYITDSTVFDKHRDFGNQRFAAHLALLGSQAKKGIVKGLETEMMHDGRFDFDPAFRCKFDVLIGSVHWLPENKRTCTDAELIKRHWLAHTLKLIDSGISVLGHPFRWISNQTGSPIDASIVKLVVAHAKAAGVALELNSHYKIAADEEMLRQVVDQGATLALSTDSHRKDEILNLSYHAGLLSSLGMKESDFKLFTR